MPAAGLPDTPPDVTVEVAVAAPNRFKPHLFNITLRGMDELSHFPSVEARQRALNGISSSVSWWELALGILVTGAGTIAVLFGARELIDWLVPHPDRLAREALDLLRIALAVAAAFFIIRALHRWDAARDLRRKLLACGVPVCERCGYLLRGLAATITACPECGRAIDERSRSLIRSEAPASPASPVPPARE